MSVRYLPAAEGWLVLVASDSVLLYRGGGAEFTSSLWDAIRTTDPVQGCLDVMTRRGLNSVPSFAMASWSGVSGSDAVVLARGDASVSVTSATGVERFDGSAVTTWREHRVTGVTTLVLGERSRDDALLPLDSGVAFAAWVEVGAATTGLAVPVVDAPDARTITSLPEITSAATETGTALQESTITEPPDPSVLGGYGHLFEETVVRNIEDAAVRPPEDAETGETADPADGDHDGLTVMSGDLAELRKSRGGVSPSPAPRAMQPTLTYFLELSTGGREPLVHSALVGRSPNVSKISSGQVPRLITIPGDKDISRNHAQLVLEGGTVVVTDLHSRNGTSIILPGKNPQALRAGEPTPVIPGTVVDLGGGVRLTVIEESA